MVHWKPFAICPEVGQISEATYPSQLVAHFRACLVVLEVPLDVKSGSELDDVHSQTGKLNFVCTTAASTLMFSSGTDAVVIPYGAMVRQLQTRVLFDWKTLSELQSVNSVLVQAQLVLLGFFKSHHPALAVFADGISFVLLQPWGRGIKCWHTFIHKPGYVTADDAMPSRDPLFHHLEADARDTDLSKELVPLLAAK